MTKDPPAAEIIKEGCQFYSTIQHSSIVIRQFKYKSFVNNFLSSLWFQFMSG